MNKSVILSIPGNKSLQISHLIFPPPWPTGESPLPTTVIILTIIHGTFMIIKLLSFLMHDLSCLSNVQRPVNAFIDKAFSFISSVFLHIKWYGTYLQYLLWIMDSWQCVRITHLLWTPNGCWKEIIYCLPSLSDIWQIVA